MVVRTPRAWCTRARTLVESPAATIALACALLVLFVLARVTHVTSARGGFLSLWGEGIWLNMHTDAVRVNGAWRIFDVDSESANGLAQAASATTDPIYGVTHRVLRENSGVFAVWKTVMTEEITVEPTDAARTVDGAEREIRRAYQEWLARRWADRAPQAASQEDAARTVSIIHNPTGVAIDAGILVCGAVCAWSLLWIPRVPARIAAARARRRERIRRARNDRTTCMQCGYSAQGIEQEHCPECGAEFPWVAQDREERSAQA